MESTEKKVDLYKIYDRFRGVVSCMLSAGGTWSQSHCRSCRPHNMWFFSRHNVAWYDKHNISKDKKQEEQLFSHYWQWQEIWEGSIGPAIVGFVTQNAGNNLKAGMLAGCAFPIVLVISVCMLKVMKVKQ